MTITNYTDLELRLQAEVDALKADNENLRAYAKHERSLGAEAFAMENLDLTQQVEILKAKLAEREQQEPDSTCPLCSHQQNEVHVHCNNCGETYTIEYTKGTP